MNNIERRISFIGGGNMAQALIGGLRKRGVAAELIDVVEPDAATRAIVQQRFGVVARPAVSAFAADAALVLAVKPQVLQKVCVDLAESARDRLVISIAAGVRAQDIARWLGYARVVRAMPNTPAMIGLGVTGLAALNGDSVSNDDRALAEVLMDAVGQAIWFSDEAQLDAVTAISGSGPAYVFYFIEALQQAGVALGLSAEQSRLLAIGTFTGAAQLAAQSDDSVSVLRERVTSQGGTTDAALTRMRELGVANAIIAGAEAAARRSRELGDQLGSQA